MPDWDKIAFLRRQFTLTYQQADAVLHACGNDLLKALDMLEEQKRSSVERADRHIWELVEEYAKRL